jgi:hypothetical protein
MSKYNHRLSYRKRRAKAVERTKPAVRRRSDVIKQETIKTAKTWFASLILFPVAVISLFTIVEMVFMANQKTHFWRTAEFLIFVLGGVTWALCYWFGWRPIKSYVFAHEFTHLVIARAFGGKIYDWRVSAEGGYVETNKSNTWITLGPYLVPFYTLIVLVGFGAVGLFVDMSRWQPLQIADMTLHYRWVWLLDWLVGFTWCYHLTFTVQTIHIEQGDLTRNGEFFSLMLIFIVNLALIAGLFVAATPGVDLHEVGNVWLDMAKSGWRLAAHLFGADAT